MNIIDIMEIGIFIQAVYRRCIFDDIKYNSDHNGYGHFKRASMEGNALETGFMIMYCDDKNYSNDLVEYLRSDHRNKLINNIVDIGSMYDSEVFEEIMLACVSKKIKIDYFFRYKYTDRVFNSDGMTQAFYNISLQHRAKKALLQSIEKYSDTIIGILPYKLLDVYITPVQKEINYISTSGALSKSKKVIDCINDHRKIVNGDRTEILKSIKKYKL
jgi:restriction endonuclease Mrr